MVFQNNPYAIKRYAPFMKPLDVPTSKIDDAPYVCLKLNEQWLPFVLGAVETMRWDDLYKGTDEQVNAAMQEVERLFLAIAAGNMPCLEDAMIRLRQNPIDPCQLQASYDGGLTFQTVFDYALCMSDQTTVNITIDDLDILNQQIINDMVIYNGDITNVYNNWGYGDADDVYRDDAMCWALRRWVDIVCEWAIKALHEELEDEQDFLRRVAYSLGGVSEVAGILAGFSIFVPGMQWMAIGFALASTATAFYAELLEVDPAVFLDEDAKEDVACAIYAVMEGTTPTFFDWSNALVGHGLSGNAGKIADAAIVTMQSEEAFVEFFEIVGDMIDVSKAGADLGCPCAGDWLHKWIFDAATGSDPLATYDNQSPQWSCNFGAYDLVTGGWYGVPHNHGAWCSEAVQIRIDFPPRTITRVYFRGDYKQGYVPAGDQDRDGLKIYTIQGAWSEALGIPFAWLSDGEISKEWSGHREDVTGIVVLFRCSYDDEFPPENYGDGHAIINQVSIEGHGLCPF